MVFNFSGLLNRKYKKINGKVRFVGIRQLPKNVNSFRCSVLCSVGYGLLSASEIEAARRVIRKVIGKNRRIKVMTRVFPYIPLTGKPSEVRMGRGKGSRIRKWVSFVKPGKVIFEIKNISSKKGLYALRKAAEKISVRSKFISLIRLRSLKHKI